MTVLPVRSTRRAHPAGRRSPFFPIRVNVPFSTRNAESGIGAPPSPMMSCAPSNRTALLAVAGAGWLVGGVEQAAKNRRQHEAADKQTRPALVAQRLRPAVSASGSV